MKNSWAQPSLSRDFALLSAAIFFLLFLVSAWVTYSAYEDHTQYVNSELEKESVRVEQTLAWQMQQAEYMLTSLGRQIVVEPTHDRVRLAQILKSFDSKGNLYAIFSWVSPDGKLIVSSNRGVLEEPVDVSDREYIQKAMADNAWKMSIGRPIEGRVSNRWVIPLGMAITDSTGKFIGIVNISLDIKVLTDQVSDLVRREGISFAIVSKTLTPLAQVSSDKDFVTHNFPPQKLVDINFSSRPMGLVSHGSLFWGEGNYAYYRVSNDYPYIILLGYDPRISDETVRNLLLGRLLLLFVMANFFLLFLWIVRVRVIKPVLDMTDVTAAVAKGEPYRPMPKGGPVEIAGLAAQVEKMAEYIAEKKRVEDELRHKLSTRE